MLVDIRSIEVGDVIKLRPRMKIRTEFVKRVISITDDECNAEVKVIKKNKRSLVIETKGKFRIDFKENPNVQIVKNFKNNKI